MGKQGKGQSEQVIALTAELARPLAADMALRLWDVEFVQEAGQLVLRFVLDAEQGVDLDTCERFSALIEPLLDQADPIADSYCLEVSSAGLNRTLRLPEHFAFCNGMRVEVDLKKPLAESCPEGAGRKLSKHDKALPAKIKRFEAVLVGEEDGTLTLKDLLGDTFSLPLSAAERVRLAFEQEV